MSDMKWFRCLGSAIGSAYEGWCYTGNIAQMNEDGYFYIVDRTRDMILSGCFNVGSRDIEAVLYEHFGRQEACAIGFPDDMRGVKVFVAVKEGGKETPKALGEYCTKKMAKDKLPKSIAGGRIVKENDDTCIDERGKVP